MFRWLVNLGFLALPIGVTIGILLGLQAQRDSSGGPPLFHKPDGAPPINNKITYVESCEKAFGIHPLSKGQKFTRESSLALKLARAERAPCQPFTLSRPMFLVLMPRRPRRAVTRWRLTACRAVNPNQWGVKSADPSGMCMNVGATKRRSRLALTRPWPGDDV